MKPTLTLRTFFIAAFFVSFISITSAQRNYSFVYFVDVTADQPQLPFLKDDTVTVVDPVTLKEETKIIHSGPPPSPILALFKNDSAAAPFRDSLISGLESGAIKAYDNIDDKNPLSHLEIKKHFHAVDTITIINPVTLKEEVKIVSFIGRIDRIRFYEDWSIDKAGNIAKKVKGYSLLAKDYDPAGNLRGYMRLATIKSDTK